MLLVLIQNVISTLLVTLGRVGINSPLKGFIKGLIKDI